MICKSCSQDKPESEFYRTHKGNSFRQPCKPCYQEQLQARRKAKGPDYYKNVSRQQRQKRQKYLDDYLRSHPCIDCGEADPVVLQFDHVEPNPQGLTVKAVARDYGIQRIREEISRCEVRCANCHIKRHARTNGRTARLNI